MAIKNTPRKEFDPYATVADMIEACEDLRAQVGPDAVLRFTGVIEVSLSGTRVKAVTAEPAKDSA